MNCRFDYIDNNVKKKSYADKLTNLVLDTWKLLINSNLFTRKNNSLLFSKENTINRGRQEELISNLNSNHSTPIIFNKENKVIVDVTGLIDIINNAKFENTDLFNSFVNSIYDNYEKTGIIQQYTNDLFSTEEIVVDKDYEAIKDLFEENPELANSVYEAAGIRNPNITVLPNGNLKIVAFRTEKVGHTSKGEYQRGKGLYLSLDRPYPGEDVYTVEIEVSPKNLLDRKLGFGEISEDYFIDEKNKRVDKQLDTLHEFKQSLGIKAEIGSIDGALMNELVLFDKELINKALTSKQVYNPQQKQEAQQLYSQYLEKNPNGSVEQFKSWVNNRNDLYYQVKNIFNAVKELEDNLKSLNKTANSIGSEKNIDDILKKAGLESDFRKEFLQLLKDNPSLKSLKLSEVISSYLKEFVKESDRQYYTAIEEPLSEELENVLIDYFDKFHIRRKQLDNLKEKFGVDSIGIFDVLAKTIYYSKNRNLLTLPEEYGHVFVELLGSISNKKADNPLFKYLFDNIESWDGYKRVFRDYKNLYVTAEGNIDIYKIKKEAIGQAIGIALVRNYKVQKGDKGFWSKIQEVIDYILGLIKGIDYVSLNTTVDSIAKDILSNNYSKLDRLNKDTSNYNLLSYSETLKTQNKKDGGKALKFMQWFSQKGMIITGSLAYRLQGNVYRPEIDALHDIDNIVPSDVHKLNLNKSNFLNEEQLEEDRIYRKLISEGNYKEAKSYKIQGNLKLDLEEVVKQIDVLQDFKKEFPDTDFLYSFFNQKANAYYVTINAIWSENQELKDRFKSYSGSFNNRLANFTEEELSQLYLFDFFLRPETFTQYKQIEDKEYGLNLAHFNYSFYEKLNMMGRPKDAYDYQMWDYFNEDNILAPDFNDRLVYFQINQSQQKQNQIQEVFNEYPELSKIGTVEQYSQYLSSIGVTDIAYHHSEEDISEFTSSSERYFQKELKKKNRYIPKLDDIVFLVKKPLTEEFMSKRKFIGSWGLKTPKTLQFNAGEKIGEGVHPGIDEGIFAGIEGNYDAIDFGRIRDNKTWSEVIAITNPKNAIKLGSKQDIEGFKNYLVSNTPDKLRLVDTIQVTNDTYMIVEKDKDILPQIQDYTNYKLLGNKYGDYLTKSNLYDNYLEYLDDKDNYTPTLILPIGIAGSGKSTWINSLINKDNYTIISPDNIRKELTGSISDQSKNIAVFQIADKLMYDSLRQEKPTIIDATNLNTVFRRKLISEVLDKYPNTKIYYKFMTSNPIISKQRITKDITNNKDRANVPFDIIDKQYDQYLQSLEYVKEEQLTNYDTIVHSYKQLEEMLALDNVHSNLLFNSIPKSTTNVYDYGTSEQLAQFKELYNNLDSISTKMKWLEYINYKPSELLVKDVPYLLKAFPNQREERVNKVLNDIYNEQQYLLYINSLKQELIDNFDAYSPILNRIGIYTFDDLNNYDNNTLLKDLCQ